MDFKFAFKFACNFLSAPVSGHCDITLDVHCELYGVSLRCESGSGDAGKMGVDADDFVSIAVHTCIK